WITLKFFNAIGLVRDLKVAKIASRMPVEEAACGRRLRTASAFELRRAPRLLYSFEMIAGRRRSVIFSTVLGICLVAIAVTLNVSWIVLHWGNLGLAILGVIFCLLIIAGMVLNTIFLVREIRR